MKDSSFSSGSRDVTWSVLSTNAISWPWLEEKACTDDLPDGEVELGSGIISGISMLRQLVFAIGLTGRV